MAGVSLKAKFVSPQMMMSHFEDNFDQIQRIPYFNKT